MDVTGIQKGTVDRQSPDAIGRKIPLLQKGVDTASRTITIVGSTINIDRDGEVILPSAYQETLPKFLASNAPFKAQHMRQTATGAPTQIGWVMAAAIRDEEVEFRSRLARTAAGEEWWLLASDPEGKGIAASVGFRPEEWMTGTPADLGKALPELVPVFKRAKIAADAYLRVYTKLELFELSGVDCPSNRESIQVLAAKAFGADGAEALDKLADAVFERLKVAVDGKVLVRDVAAAIGLDQALKPFQSKLEEVRDLLVALVPDFVNPRLPGGSRPDSGGDRADGGGEGAGAKLIKDLVARLRG